MAKRTVFFLSVTILALLIVCQLPHSSWSSLSHAFLSLSGLLVWLVLLAGDFEEPSFLEGKSVLPFVAYGLILPLFILPSMLTALSYHQAFLGFFKLLAVMGIMIGAFFASLDKKGKKILEVFIYFLLLLYCTVGIYQMVSPAPMPTYWTGEAQRAALPFRVSSLFVNPNIWGGFCAILVVVLTSVILTSGKGEKNMRICFLLILFLANLAGSFSRGGWLSAIGGLFFTGIFLWYKKIACPGKINLLKAIGVGIIPLICLLAPAVSSRFSTLTSPSEFGMAQRVLLYKGVLSHVTDNLPLGSGPGSFQSLFPKYRLVSGQYVYEAHSDYLQFLAEAGISGFTGFIFFIGGALLYCLRSKRGNSSLHLFAFFITIAVGANAVTFFHYYFLIVPLLIIGAVIIGQSQFSFPIPSDFQSEGKFIRSCGILSYVRVSLGMVCISGIVFWSSVVISQYYKVRAEKLVSQNPPQLLQSLEDIDRAISIAPLRGDLYYAKGKMWLQISILASTENHKSHGRANALECFNKAVELNPSSGRYKKSRAVLSVMANDYPKALYYISQALVSDRCSSDFAFNKAVILERLGKVDEAVSTLKESLSIGGRFVFIDHESYRPVVTMLLDLLHRSNASTEAREIQLRYGKLLKAEGP